MYRTFYVPRTKRELVIFLSRAINESVSALKKRPTKQLYAIYYRVRSEDV